MLPYFLLPVSLCCLLFMGQPARAQSGDVFNAATGQMKAPAFAMT